jgi:hypothetical protein
MPAYDFDLLLEGGEVLATVPVILPVEARDRVFLRRRTVPGSISLAGAATDATAQGREVMKDYHKLEEKHGSRFRSGFKPEEIKRAWKE